MTPEEHGHLIADVRARYSDPHAHCRWDNAAGCWRVYDATGRVLGSGATEHLALTDAIERP